MRYEQIINGWLLVTEHGKLYFETWDSLYHFLKESGFEIQIAQQELVG